MMPADPTVLLTRLLDAATLRDRVIAHNIANVNTPGHRCLEVSFEQQLTDAQASSSATDAAPKVVVGAGGIARADGNNVDIDLEMGRLHKNSILFQLYTQLLSTQLAQHRSAISGRS